MKIQFAMLVSRNHRSPAALLNTNPATLTKMEQPKTLEEMTLEELIASLPLPPLDPNDPDPLMRMIARQELGLKPDTVQSPSKSSSD